MKKSQILAALALAFALGVVAPVAVATPAVYAAVETNTDQETANAEAVLVAANVAKQGVVYEGYETVAKAVSESWAAYNSTSALSALNTALDAVVDDYEDATTIEAAVATATGLAQYGDWVNLYNEMTSTTSQSVDNLISYAAKVKITVTKGDSDEFTLTNVTAAINANDEYKAMKAVIEAEQPASKALTQQSERAGALETALKNIPTVDKVALNDALAAKTEGAKLTALMAIATSTNGTARATAYGALRTAIANAEAKGALTADASNANYVLLQAIADGYKSATGNELVVSGIVIPSDKPEADDKPATDDKNLPNAGNTGVIAGADATAKATVSIMAAIASVATAAFVAIRKIAAGKKA